MLIAQHFDGGFAEDGEIERRLFYSRIGENELMRHRCFAAPRRAGDDIERKLRNAAAHDVVEAAHASGQFTYRDLRGGAPDTFRRFTFVRVNLLFHIYLFGLTMNR